MNMNQRVSNRDVLDRLCKIERDMAHSRDLMPPEEIQSLKTNVQLLCQKLDTMTSDIAYLKKHVGDWVIARSVLKALAWFGGSVALLGIGAWIRNWWGGK